MFDKGYKFREVNHVKGNTVNEPFIKAYRFTFKGKNKCKYVVWAQEYSYHFFAIKFHLNSHQHRADKYEVLTNYHDATRIIRTCEEIMLYMYKKIPTRLLVLSEIIRKAKIMKIQSVFGFINK